MKNRNLKFIFLILSFFSCQKFNSSFVTAKSGTNDPTPNGPVGVGTVYFSANDSGVYKMFKLEGGVITEALILPEDTSLNSITYFNGFYYLGLSGHGNSRDGELYKIENDALVQVFEISSSGSSNPKYLTVHNGEIFFSANDGTGGRELWKMNATEQVSLVSDIEPGSMGSFPQSLTSFSGKLYFSATTLNQGNELRVYNDGNLSIVSNAVSGGRDSFPSFLHKHEGELYFSSIKSTSRSPTAEIGSLTTLEGFFNKVSSSGSTSEVASASIDIKFPVSLGGVIYTSCSVNRDNTELCKLNSQGNFESLGDINPEGGAGQANASKPSHLTVFNGKIYFSAYRDSDGVELWEYSPSSGIKQVKDIYPGVMSSHPSSFWVFENKLYFSANDGSNGHELWSVNASGVASLEKDLFVGSGSSYPEFPFSFYSN